MFGQFGTGPKGPIEYKILTEDKIEEALNVQQISMRQENIALGVGMYEEEGAAEAMKIIFREVIKDNCTIVAVDLKSGEIVGASFNKLHVPLVNGEVDPLGDIVENQLKPRSSRSLVNFLDDIESKVDMFERYDTKAAMEIFYVGTLPGYQGYKIGHGLAERTIELAKNFAKYEGHCRPQPVEIGVIFGVFTSNYSQSIASRLHFEWLEIVRYEDREIDGVKMSEKIGKVHQTAKLGALKLN